MVGIFIGVADKELDDMLMVMPCVRMCCCRLFSREKMGRCDSQIECADKGNLANGRQPHATIYKTPKYRSIETPKYRSIWVYRIHCFSPCFISLYV